MKTERKLLRFERKPTLNWLVGDADKGHYIPHSSLKENNAEVTTGVDFDGDGKLTEGVKADFINAAATSKPSSIVASLSLNSAKKRSLEKSC